MDRTSRAELIRTVETQREQIQKYEARLRDVVQAYKGLIKEKEALESSVKVLSAAQSRIKDSSSQDGGTSDRERESDLESEEGAQVQDPLHATSLQVPRREEEALEEQIQTLSASIITLTEEKSKLETGFVADKKRLKQEKEELQKVVETLQEKLEKENKDFTTQLQELKSKVRGQQMEREKEQTDNMLMLKELQKLVEVERTAKEKLEGQVEEFQFSLREKEGVVSSISSQYEKQVQDLRGQLKTVKEQLKAEKEKADQPSELVLDLQREAAELQAKHRLHEQQEQNIVSEAEKRVKVFSQQSENRISELEEKISELSEVVGKYEKLKFQDQQTIHRLKERVTQLDLENTALARATNMVGNDQQNEQDENLDIQTIVDKLVKLKGQLKLANEKAERPVSIEDLLTDEDSIQENPLVKKYREELEQLKDEFERYKLRAQSVLKNKVTKENTPSKETELLKEHINDLREKLKNLHIQQDEETEHYRQREENLRKMVMSLQEKHKQEVTQLQGEHHTLVQELEEEIKKQRERTVSMLAEKDRELETLRATSPQRIETDYMMRYRQNHDMGGASSEVVKTEEEEAVRQLLSPRPPGGQGEMTLLYFAQEQARKDVEIAALRKQKHELETGLRELQFSTSTKEESLYDEIDNLKEEIRRLERSKNREGANLEYLKNVTYKFLICHDSVGKQQMLNAITTILQFSPQEKSTVHSQFRSWWTTK